MNVMYMSKDYYKKAGRVFVLNLSHLTRIYKSGVDNFFAWS